MIRAQHKPSRVIDRRYRGWARTQPCTLQSVLCLGPIDPHHVIPDGGGKTGSKVSDRRCVPLCRWHHSHIGMYANKFRDTFEAEILRLNREYDTLYPVKRETRIRQTVAKVKIEHCICGKPHTLPWGKVTVWINADVAGARAWFTCPVTNKQVKAVI